MKFYKIVTGICEIWNIVIGLILQIQKIPEMRKPRPGINIYKL